MHDNLNISANLDRKLNPSELNPHSPINWKETISKQVRVSIISIPPTLKDYNFEHKLESIACLASERDHFLSRSILGTSTA